MEEDSTYPSSIPISLVMTTPQRAVEIAVVKCHFSALEDGGEGVCVCVEEIDLGEQWWKDKNNRDRGAGMRFSSLFRNGQRAPPWAEISFSP